jgi:GT2 family glycosyltransferase
MKIAAILVNFNSHGDLLEAVETLEESQVPPGFERKVIVVENGSNNQEEEWKALQQLGKYPDVEFIKNATNTGFTGGNNLGIRRSLEWGANYVLLLNADTKVSENFLVKLLGAEVDFGLASPKIYFYPGYEFHKDRYQRKDLGKVIWYAGGTIDWGNVVGSGRHVDEVDKGQLESEIEETDFATGCCMLIKREVIEKIGLLDQKLFFSWEDTDYSIRAKQAGFRIIYVPEAVIWHKNAGTSGGAGSLLQDYYQTRNRVIIAFRYASWKVKLLLLLTLVKTGKKNRLRAIVSALRTLALT